MANMVRVRKICDRIREKFRRTFRGKVWHAWKRRQVDAAPKRHRGELRRILDKLDDVEDISLTPDELWRIKEIGQGGK